MSRIRSSQKGFTIIELMIVLALMMIIAALGMPLLQNLIHRTRLEGAAREATIFVQRARMEALKGNRRAVVEFELGSPNGMRAFLDFDEDGTFSPDPTVTEGRSTDFQVARFHLPGFVEYRGPGGGGANAFHDLTEVAGNRVLILRADGSVVNAGDFEMGDVRGNFLRLSISPAAKVTVSKWSQESSQWLPRDEGGWSWY